MVDSMMDARHQALGNAQEIRTPAPISPSRRVSRDSLAEERAQGFPLLDDATSQARDSEGYVGKSLAKAEDALWLPHTLRWYFIWIPVTLAFALGLTTILLYHKSQKNEGLSSEKSAIWGWKFAPTLIAVIYTQITSMLLNDIKRTEPFARLAQKTKTPPEALHTLLDPQRPWWTTLAHGFQKKRNGGRRSWLIILACLVNIFAFLVISPLSSALLGLEERQRTNSLDILRLASNDTSTLDITTERDTYFRTMGAVLRNITTSPWVTDEYFILPFTTTEAGDSVWNPQSSTSQVWEAETLVFRSDFQCQKIELKKTDTYQNFTGIEEDDEDPYSRQIIVSALLESDEGCRYNISGEARNWYGQTSGDGFVSWAPINRFAKQLQFDEGTSITYNDKCHGEEAVIFSSQWVANMTSPTPLLANLTASGWICSSNHTMASLPVRLSLSQANVTATFDKEVFRKSCAEVPQTMLNASQLLEKYTDPSWFGYVPSPNAFNGLADNNIPFGGAGALLGTRYAFNIEDMKNDAGLPEAAAGLRRQFFSEIMRSSVSRAPQAAEDQQRVAAKRTVIERRIAVNAEVAYTLCVLFFVSFVMLLVGVWLSRLRQRPLNMVHDPNTVLGLASLVASQPGVLNSLRGLDQSSRKDLKMALKGQVYATSPGHLHRAERGGQFEEVMTTKKTSKTKHWTPSVMRRRTLSALAVYIIGLMVAISVLYSLSIRSRLTQTLFTYRTNIEALGSFGAFAPFSVLPTFFAICLGLWWDAIDKSVRSLQPIISMSKGPTRVSRGAGTSYQSCYWLWASAKGVSKRAWLLSLITLGTFLAQAFIITMSALFQQGTGIIDRPVDIPRTLELRRIPDVEEIQVLTTGKGLPPDRNQNGVTYVYDALQKLFTDLSTNWMYTAVIQATLNGSEPAWSKDGWSFIPLNISDVPEVHAVRNPQIGEEKDLFEFYSSSNVTARTPAIRARLACTRVTNTSEYFQQWDDPADLERIGLRRNISEMYLPRPILSASRAYLQCCANQTDPKKVEDYTMSVAVGYWTMNNADDEESETGVSGTDGNFTVRWVHGEAGMGEVFESGEYLFFPQVPKVEALNCMPIIEAAEAQVTIDRQLGFVQTYNILEEKGSEDAAWTDTFVLHEPDDPAKIGNVSENRQVPHNMTTSYGVLFMHALLRAASLADLDSNGGLKQGSLTRDALEDQVFNIRNNDTGLNLDFMSYASYTQVQHNPSILLNHDLLLSQTQKTFALFFQHFVSSQVSLSNGGWAYQPVGTKPLDLPPPVNSTARQRLPGGQPAPDASSFAQQDTQRLASATLSTRVEVLRMDPVAFWVAVALLVWLIGTIGVVIVVQQWYLGNMMRNVECVADVLVLIAGSRGLLGLVTERGVMRLLEDDDLFTMLGWFVDGEGRMRWGIEVVDRKMVVGGEKGSRHSYWYVPVRTAGGGEDVGMGR